MEAQGSNRSPEVLQFLKYCHFVRHWGVKVFYKIYSLSFLQGQNANIREILEDNQIPLQGRRCPFSREEIQNITEKAPEDLDITVMNKICQALWQKGVNDPGDEIRGLLKKIKNEKNFVSHEESHMSEPDLERKLRDFQATLEETLEKTKSLFPSNSGETDQLKAEIQYAVPKLLEKIREKYDPSNPQDRQRLQKEIEECGSELSDMIQKSAEAELLSLHKRLCQILPYDWLAQYGTTDPGNIMVCLRVKDDKELNIGPHGNKSIIVNQKEILNKDKMGKDPEVVIISGDAGSGKTTILCSYAEGWCKKTMDIPELSSFKFLLHMQFGNHEHDNFDDYLKSLIPTTVAQFPFELVKSVVLDSKCLILCDGYDEANEKSRKLFKEFLELNLKNTKFVVTTRPGNTMGLTDIVNEGKRSRINLRVSGLQEEDMKLLTEKLIGHLVNDDVTQVEQMKKELLQKIEEMDTGTRAILQTPLYFNMFILLYIECPELRDEMSTRTSVYLQLRKHKIKRISCKTGVSVESLEEFDALYRKWSLKHYTEEKYEWSEADVRSFKREISSLEVLQNFDAIMSSYFSIKKRKKQQGIVKVYCHGHRNEQEFAVAGSICDDIITSSGRPQGGNIIRDIITSTGRLRRGNIIRDIIASIGRPRRGNIPRDVLVSKGLWDRSDLGLLFMKFSKVISFIPGILYSTERDVLHKTIDNIHELYVLYSPSNDALLEPCTETRLDDKVLDSLVSQMERKTSLKDQVVFFEPKSLYVLPSLLPKLRPKEIGLTFSFSKVPRHLSHLRETLYAASQSNIHTKIHIRMWLREYAQCPGQEEVLHPVDELALGFHEDGYQDLENLRPFPLMISSKELTLKYFMEDSPEDRVAQVINRTLVRANKEGGSIDLEIFLWKDSNIKLLLQSLTVPPLRLITIFPLRSTKTDDVEELRTLCREKAIQQLSIWPHRLHIMGNPDGEYKEKEEEEDEEVDE